MNQHLISLNQLQTASHPNESLISELRQLKGLCFPLIVIAGSGSPVGETTLASLCQVSRGAARRWLVELTRLGYLQRLSHFQGYTLTPLAKTVLLKLSRFEENDLCVEEYILPEETQSQPTNGLIQSNDGQIITNDDQIQTDDGHIPSNDNQILQATDSQIRPIDGQILTNDDQIQANDEPIRSHDGQKLYIEGTKLAVVSPTTTDSLHIYKYDSLKAVGPVDGQKPPNDDYKTTLVGVKTTIEGQKIPFDRQALEVLHLYPPWQSPAFIQGWKPHPTGRRDLASGLLGNGSQDGDQPQESPSGSEAPFLAGY